jgi:hypothetical protein
LTQEGWNHLGGNINPFNPALRYWLDAQNLSLAHPITPLLLGQELLTQATMLAFVQVFRLIALSFVVMAPLILLLRAKSGGAPGPTQSRSAFVMGGRSLKRLRNQMDISIAVRTGHGIRLHKLSRLAG